ncbi:thioredoxin family protein [Pontibacter flavimaris]|uniref:Thioredoxin n=1 Tax=Pontibacter flavimaris TaxID=1797110 RepID=A0A1Q5PC02_9BACT|nr:thioredoxin domain-containing protein [Pontibacter flavimaris]OKL39779.1 hypothetical protein A3841_00720 [Pontibacter flavimaris]
MKENTLLIEIDDTSFEHEVLHAPTPVLVCFSAGWCSQCEAMVPVLEELAEKYEGRIKFLKLDVDANAQSSVKYRVRSLPTLLIFQNGEVVEEITEVLPKHALAEILEARSHSEG